FPPSCQVLENKCGPNGNGNCCDSPTVDGGSFMRSNDPAYPATVASFRLDAYEVTVGRFRQFLADYSPTMIDAGAGKNPNDSTDPGWDVTYDGGLESDAAAVSTALHCYNDLDAQMWTDATGDNENKAINCVSWFEAYAFCIWD